MGALENFCKFLLFAFIQRKGLRKRFRLSHGLLVVAEALLPADAFRHPF